jgi:aminopeptidase N
VGRQALSNQDSPLEIGKVIGNAGGQYFKTAAVLQMLRRDIMGPDLFDKGLKTYIQRWAYKHPTPVDFFRTMSEAAGRNLDWYWREWFLEAPRFDQSIDSVSQTTQGNDTHMTVIYGSKERGVMPLLVQFTFSDSTTQDFTYPVDVWKTNGSTFTASYTFTGKTPTQIKIDPGAHFVDMKRANNTWTK